jgi:hypothetical protein
MIDHSATDGERLCNYINHRLLSSSSWEALALALEPTGRASDLIDFYRELAAVTQTGRIVSAGRSLAEKFGIDSPELRKEFTSLLREYFGIPSKMLDEFFRFSQRAVTAALEPLRKSVQNEMEAWAVRNHTRCYMCATTLDFLDRQQVNSYTCDHVWPRAYGGNSIPENLLPACYSCNSIKKGNFATWVMPAIQSLVLGLTPESGRLQEINGSYKFSIHYRVAQRVATNRRITIKNAFLEIGPWKDVRIRDVDDVVDIFNLENHDSDIVFV